MRVCLPPTFARRVNWQLGQMYIVITSVQKGVKRDAEQDIQMCVNVEQTHGLLIRCFGVVVSVKTQLYGYLLFRFRSWLKVLATLMHLSRVIFFATAL